MPYWKEDISQWGSRAGNGDQLCSLMWDDQENGGITFRNVHWGYITESLNTNFW